MILMLLLCTVLLTACGKKPNKLEAPDNAREQTEPAGKYPRTYPKNWL
jgi:hypothetical protein